jgi:hypothetical protein
MPNHFRDAKEKANPLDQYQSKCREILTSLAEVSEDGWSKRSVDEALDQLTTAAKEYARQIIGSNEEESWAVKPARIRDFEAAARNELRAEQRRRIDEDQS